MKIIDDILDVLSSIEAELYRVNDICDEDELENWREENLQRAYELLQDVNDLVG